MTSEKSPATVDEFIRLATRVLDEIGRSGKTPDFVVVCDSSLNTPDAVDRNELRAQIRVNPRYSAFAEELDGDEFEVADGVFEKIALPPECEFGALIDPEVVTRWQAPTSEEDIRIPLSPKEMDDKARSLGYNSYSEGLQAVCLYDDLFYSWKALGLPLPTEQDRTEAKAYESLYFGEITEAQFEAKTQTLPGTACPGDEDDVDYFRRRLCSELSFPAPDTHYFERDESKLQRIMLAR